MSFFKTSTPEEKAEKAWAVGINRDNKRLKFHEAMDKGYYASALRICKKYGFSYDDRYAAFEKAIQKDRYDVLEYLVKNYAFDFSYTGGGDRKKMLQLFALAEERQNYKAWNILISGVKNGSDYCNAIVKQCIARGNDLSVCNAMNFALSNDSVYPDIVAEAAMESADDKIFKLVMSYDHMSQVSHLCASKLLLKAVQMGKCDRAADMIACGAILSYSDNAAFNWAYQHGDEAIIKLFTDKGFDINNCKESSLGKAPDDDMLDDASDAEKPQAVWSEKTELADGLTLTTVFNFVTGQETVVSERDDRMNLIVRDFADINPDVIQEALRKLTAAHPGVVVPPEFAPSKTRLPRAVVTAAP